jgi:signal transduction histidine kinase
MRYYPRGRSGPRPPRGIPASDPSMLFSRRVPPEQWTEQLRLTALANLAHELRTPIQVLLGYLDTLKDQMPELPTESNRVLERMNANACELARVVENIMEFAREEGRKEVNGDEEVSTLELLDEVMPLIESVNQDKKLELRFDLDDAPAVIHARHRQLRLILANLAVNAVRFTSAGSVTIAIRRAGRPGRPQVSFEVIDTGPGISAELREQIFKPFVQLASRSNRQYSGLGLGLTVVKRCVAALKGKLALQSTPGHGARFIVRIPVNPHGAGSLPLKGN